MSREERVVVRLPNLTTSFLSQQPRVNENYENASQISKDWVIKACELDGTSVKGVKNGDFAYFVAVAAPDAESGRLQTFSDWVHWVFPFDDEFDNGSVKDDPEEARKVLDNLVECMHGIASPATKFLQAHGDVWVRMKKVSILRRSGVEELY